jgi:5'-deoxynucleotidase
MKENSFFAMLSRMRYIRRWGLMRNSAEENLTEHSYDTAVLAHALALIGNTVFGKSYDADHLAVCALFHDCPEIITGDMPSPVKYRNPGIRAAYAEVETEAGESLLSGLPQGLRTIYRELLFLERDHPGEYACIKAADKLSAYLKCVEEIRSGNAEFKKAAAGLKKSIAELGMPEADYFMENFAPAYSLTLDEIQK